MCLSPILVKNPNYNRYAHYEYKDGKRVLVHERQVRHDTRSYQKDTVSQYIEMRCGHCAECLSLKQTYIRQRAIIMAQTHDIYFATLTYNEEMLPKMDVNGFTHSYADIHDFQTMVKYMRKIDFFGKPFKYICCTEYGGKKHRPHFHVLFFVEKDNVKESEWDAWNRQQFWYWSLLKLWRRNVSTDINASFASSKRIRVNTRNAVYKPLCTYVKDRRGRSTYDFHLVVPRRTKNGVADVATYVTKYVLKFDEWIIKKQQALHLNLNSDEYKRVWNLIKPRVLISKNFGNGITVDSDGNKSQSIETAKLVRRGIDKSLSMNEKYFLFIDPTTGKTSPLSPYLRKYFATIVDHDVLYLNNKVEDNVMDLSDDYKGYALANRLSKYRRTYMALSSRNTDDFYELE